MLVGTARRHREWEVHDGYAWNPFPLPRKQLIFMVPYEKDIEMKGNMKIGHYKGVVGALVTE